MFFAYHELCIDTSDTLWITQPNHTLALYCIADMLAIYPSHVIPSRLFIPYGPGTIRRDLALQRTDMLPIFFRRTDGGVGITIHNADISVNALLDDPTRITATSLKVFLHLINYSPIERQIQLRTSSTSPQSISVQRLARLVASKVCCFWRTAEAENNTITDWNDPRWMVGPGAGRMNVGDIILLGIAFVSPGKVTPLLQVRPDFVFMQ
ncbi:unnamed protein product [Peniophora sp. CBMAI 1063]|nr:unnamed protein product [Peniophora sp. CBMAI 1063]